MLGRDAIIEAMKDGRIQIDPYDSKKLGPNSYDLTLGNFICRMRNEDTNSRLITLTSPVNWQSMWNPPSEVQNGMLRLAPYELVLAHTMERIGCFVNVVGEMASRSTIMRSGIAVCIDAGLGDVGFNSKWTMEIFNHTPHFLDVPIGIRIAQMKFHEVDNAGYSYEEKGGTYGLGEWNPEDMLPRSSL